MHGIKFVPLCMWVVCYTVMLCSTDQQLLMFQDNCLSQLQWSGSPRLAIWFRLVHIKRL